MLKVAVSGTEIDLLRGLALLAQVLYLLGLRPRMDYGTGVVGGRGGGRVTRDWLRTVAEFVPDAGSTRKRHKPTPEQVRAALRELERRGLIVDDGCSRENGLIFFLPYASRDESVQNGNPRISPRMNPRGAPEDSSCNYNVLGGVEGGVNPTTNPTGNPRLSGSIKPNTGGGDARAYARDAGVVSEGELAKALRDRYVNVTSMHPVLRGWVDRGVTLALALEAVEIARRTKSGQLIPAAYLDPIIQRMLEQRDQPATTGRSRHAAGSGVSGGRVSQCEQTRRQGIEHLRRIGQFADDEWADFCREIGEPGRADPLAAADGDPVDADGGAVSASVGEQDGAGGVVGVCDLDPGARRRDH
ncbi:MAG: hypothetical protein GY788_07345 [bacterium]|nr:hypothetical protein [bacterium]